MVRPPILTLLLLLAGPAMAAGEVPRFDIQKICRAAADLKIVDEPTIAACVSIETQARADLERQWASFNPSQRNECVQETNIGGSPSYVEVLTCLQMQQDASSPAPPPGGQTSK